MPRRVPKSNKGDTTLASTYDTAVHVVRKKLNEYLICEQHVGWKLELTATILKAVAVSKLLDNDTNAVRCNIKTLTCNIIITAADYNTGGVRYIQYVVTVT